MNTTATKSIFKISGSEFSELRERALDFLEQAEIPDRKSEEYKYTPIAQNLQKNFPDFNPVGKCANESINKINVPTFDSYQLVIINGSFKPEISNLPEALVVTEINSLGPGNSDIIGSSATPDANFFVALNTIQFNEGLILNVPKGVVIDKPVSIINLLDGTDQKCFCSPRLAISLNENSQISFYEFSFSIGDNASFSNSVTEIFVAESALGNYTQLQLQGENTSSHNSLFISQKKKSNFTTNTITLGGFMVRNNLTYILDGENIESHLFGLYLSAMNQQIDNHTIVDHRMPNSYSNEIYKGILMDKSKGVFNGKIYVRPNAQMTNAYQSNKNILLSDDATISTKPQLEIWADDVKCSHGCTTGQMDEEQIFYLRSRGIDKDTAVAMVLNAFQHDILNKIPHQEIIDYLDEIVTNKIGKIY